MKGPVRKPVIAGSWYPDDPRVLKHDIEGYIRQAAPADIPRKPAAIISPHAGYLYSGSVAAQAYSKLIGHSYSTVVVISPSHRAYFPYVSVWTKGSFETPLGSIDIDEGLCAKLLETSVIFTDNTRPHGSEHALEIQLPFLQTVLPPFALCPLIMGQQDMSLCQELSGALLRAISNPDDVLVVASTDLSHFHPASQAEAMDSEVTRLVETLDVEGLGRALAGNEVEACGGGPIMTALLYAKGISRSEVKILEYTHSGQITGDNSSVVGYLSAVVF
jgi:MEMO1 family protein